MTWPTLAFRDVDHVEHHAGRLQRVHHMLRILRLPAAGQRQRDDDRTDRFAGLQRFRGHGNRLHRLLALPLHFSARPELVQGFLELTEVIGVLDELDRLRHELADGELRLAVERLQKVEARPLIDAAAEDRRRAARIKRLRSPAQGWRPSRPCRPPSRWIVGRQVGDGAFRVGGRDVAPMRGVSARVAEKTGDGDRGDPSTVENLWASWEPRFRIVIYPCYLFPYKGHT